MHKAIKDHKTVTLLWLLAVLLSVTGAIFFNEFIAFAQGQRKFFSSSPVSSSSTGQDTWTNGEAAANPELTEQASLAEFNTTNSAYLFGNAPMVSSPVDVATTTASDTGVDTTSAETVIDVPAQPAIQSQVLEFSGFGLSAEEIADGIESARLGLSLAGQGEAGDKLTLEYYSHDSWQNLAELNLGQEISNNTNGGYFSYPLSLLKGAEDFAALKIRLVYSGQGREKIYLDGLWLDMEMGIGAGVGNAGNGDTATSTSVTATTTAETTVTTTTTTEVTTVDSVSVADKSTVPVDNGQLLATTTEKIKPEPVIVKKMPAKFFQFSLAQQVINSTTNLDWYPEDVALDQAKPENTKINLKAVTPAVPEANVKAKLIFSGACQKKYFVILAFAQPDDYVNDPGKSIYNKAFLCRNNNYYHELSDLPEGLAAGVYYFMVAEQGETGSWQPISAIQPVNIQTVEK